MSDIIERELTPPSPSITRGTLLSRPDIGAHLLVSTTDGSGDPDNRFPDGQTVVFVATADGYIDELALALGALLDEDPWHTEPADHEAGIAEARNILADVFAGGEDE